MKRGTVKVISKKESLQSQLVNANDFYEIDCTSKSIDGLMKELSPFYLGPIECYDNMTSLCMENAWQYAKVYEGMVDEYNNPTQLYYDWRNNGFKQQKAKRYPLGKGIKPLYSFWKINGNYYKLGYIEARKLIYIPLYAKAVVKTDAYKKLNEYLANGYNIALADFDGYCNENYNKNIKQVVNNPNKTMGHSFVIKMLLDGLISVVNNEVIYSDTLKNMQE